MDGELLTRNHVESLHQEANELTAISVSSLRTAKSSITNQKGYIRISQSRFVVAINAEGLLKEVSTVQNSAKI